MFGNGGNMQYASLGMDDPAKRDRGTKLLHPLSQNGAPDALQRRTLGDRDHVGRMEHSPECIERLLI